MKLWTAPSTRSCLKNAIPLSGDSNTFVLDAAKGELASMQILIRNEVQLKDDEDAKTKIINILGAKVLQTKGSAFDISSIRIQVQEYISFADGILYPDAIANHCTVDVYPNTTQGIWVTFPLSSGMESGEYQFRIQFESNTVNELFADITLYVYNVEIPTPDEGEYSIEHFANPEDQVLLEHAGYSCKAFDETWWKFMEEYAKSLRECRSNVYRLYPLELLRASGSKRISKDNWEFNFTVFDRMVDLLLKNGFIKRFSIEDVLIPGDGVEIKALDENGEIIRINISDPEAEIWAKNYFTALYEHIVLYSKPENWIMHIQDEPMVAETWLWARKLVEKYIPGIRCGNPTCSDIVPLLGDNIDLYIPVFWSVEMEPELYQNILDNTSKEIWSYCCCSPAESWYLNRFIDSPAIKSRLIAWATYSRGFSGFLHYGYSWWQKTSQFYPFGIEKYSAYKGDCMLIYPSPEDNSYKISIRYINIRDGAQDYELLKIAEKVDRQKAKELSKCVASNYIDFNMDEKHFLNARRELLKLAESCSIYGV